MEHVLLGLALIIPLAILLFAVVISIILAIHTMRTMREFNTLLKNKNQNNIIKHHE